MSKLIQAATYKQLQRITDWQLAEENQRSALAVVVNAIASKEKPVPAMDNVSLSTSNLQP